MALFKEASYIIMTIIDRNIFVFYQIKLKNLCSKQNEMDKRLP